MSRPLTLTLLPASGSPALDVGQEADVSHITQEPTRPQGTQPGTQLWQGPKVLPQELRLLMYPRSECHPKRFTRMPCEPAWLKAVSVRVCALLPEQQDLGTCQRAQPHLQKSSWFRDGLRLCGLREAGAPWHSECCHPCSRSWPRPG